MPGIRVSRSIAALMVVLMAGLPPVALAPAQAQPPNPDPLPAVSLPLETLLAKAAEYCRKLESSAFDFVCREEIRETIDPKLDAAHNSLPGRSPAAIPEAPPPSGTPRYSGPGVNVSWTKKVKRSFVYDYRCIRSGRAIRETRTQLEENGKKKVVSNAELQTSVVVFGTALLAPIEMFGERFQPGYDFAIAGPDRIGGTPVLIIDARPKPGAPPTRNLYGQAWLDPATGDILRIEWSESRVGNFDVFAQRGELYKRTPRLIIRSEFSAEKNGLRFPSRLSVQETYLKGSGKAFVRSRTEVVYKDFKFFTVEFEVRD